MVMTSPAGADDDAEETDDNVRQTYIVLQDVEDISSDEQTHGRTDRRAHPHRQQTPQNRSVCKKEKSELLKNFQ